MRRLASLGIIIIALSFAPAGASHSAVACSGSAPVLTGSVSCSTVATCGAPTSCLFAATGSVSGVGLLSVRIFLNGIPIAGCGPVAGGCATAAPFNLPPGGGVGMLTCTATGPGLSVSYRCAATAAGHI